MDKKTLTSTIVAVTTLVLLVFGATYAYFTVSSDNRFGTKNITAEIEDMANNVILTQETGSLSLDLSRMQMSEANKGTYYYATGSSTPANIGKIAVDGEGSFTCSYTINVTKSATNDMYEAFQGMSTKSSGQIYYEINNKKVDFNLPLLFTMPTRFKHEFVIKGITKDNPSYITANMVIYNKDIDQSALKGTDITLTFEVRNFECKPEDGAPIFAILDSGGTLRFYQNYDTVQAGIDEDTGEYYMYKNNDVVALYSNLNNTNYTSYEDVPWSSSLDGLEVSFEEKIQPLNTAYWFAAESNEYNYYVNIDNYENFDTSNVISMEGMYKNLDSSIVNDAWRLDTSKVTNMSYMFYGSKNSEDLLWLGLENWDVSQVRDMSYMFATGGTFVLSGLDNWDTSNVANMNGMFNGADFAESIDVSSWDVSSVGCNYKNFSTVEELQQPSWSCTLD